MATDESVYATLLRSLGFVLDDHPSEARDDYLDIPKLPEKPIFTTVYDRRTHRPIVTIVVDEVGHLWTAHGHVDLTSRGFEDYYRFRTRIQNGRK